MVRYGPVVKALFHTLAFGIALGEYGLAELEVNSRGFVLAQ